MTITYTLTVDTDQDAFDAVVRRLYDGTGRAVNDYNQCMYRTADGSACAVGAIIADAGIDADMTLRQVRTGAKNFIRNGTNIARYGELLKLDSGNVSPQLLEELQMIHDAPNNWRDNDFIAATDLYRAALHHELAAYELVKALAEKAGL